MNWLDSVTEHDALVLIHADFDTPRGTNPWYLDTLEAAAAEMVGQGKPVFIFPASPVQEQPLPPGLRQLVRVIPSRDYWVCTGPEIQDHIYYMVREADVPRQEMRLAAGGVAARRCVVDWLHMWCDDVTSPVQPWRPEPTPEQKIGYGTLVSNLTDLG